MKLHGRVQQEAESDEDSPPLALREVSLLASPSELRRLASFLSHAAEALEHHGARFGHEHYSDHVGERVEGACDFIVVAVPVLPPIFVLADTLGIYTSLEDAELNEEPLNLRSYPSDEAFDSRGLRLRLCGVTQVRRSWFGLLRSKVERVRLERAEQLPSGQEQLGGVLRRFLEDTGTPRERLQGASLDELVREAAAHAWKR